MKVDVLVIGGGSAGLAAAVMAARTGARVLLVERHGVLGGMGTASLVHSFCGLYHLGGGPARLANPGFPSEMEERMRKVTGMGPVRMGKVWVLPQHPVEFAGIADELVGESGVEVRFHSELVELAQAGGGWEGVMFCRGMKYGVEAKSVVDASGDAVAAGLLDTGGERTEAARLQRPAYVFGAHGVLGELPPLVLGAKIVEGVRAGDLPKAAMGMHFRKSGRVGEVFGTLDLSGEEGGEYDPLDPGCLAAIEQVGRRVASGVVGYLREHEAGWGEAYVSHWPMRAGVRESQRWLGRACLTGDEVAAGARHADEIGLATWPMEFRETHRGPKLRFPVEDRAAGIPFGALRPAGIESLFVAGRCLSCDHDAQASIRVMGTCFATGQAAGLAAARVAAGKAAAGVVAVLRGMG